VHTVSTYPNVRALVSGKLYNLSHLLIFIDRPIALKHFLECLADFFCVEVLRKALYGGDTLAPIPVLYAQVHFPLVYVLAIEIQGTKSICIWVCTHTYTTDTAIAH
jgi:hypothetical protein